MAFIFGLLIGLVLMFIVVAVRIHQQLVSHLPSKKLYKGRPVVLRMVDFETGEVIIPDSLFDV